MIRTVNDVSELTEFEIEKRIGIRQRQVRRLEKEIKILSRVHQEKKIAAAIHRTVDPMIRPLTQPRA